MYEHFQHNPEQAKYWKSFQSLSTFKFMNKHNFPSITTASLFCVFFIYIKQQWKLKLKLSKCFLITYSSVNTKTEERVCLDMTHFTVPVLNHESNKTLVMTSLIVNLFQTVSSFQFPAVNLKMRRSHGNWKW